MKLRDNKTWLVRTQKKILKQRTRIMRLILTFRWPWTLKH